MADNKPGLNLGFLLGVAATLIVASATTWLSAYFSRTEALRQSRVTAYSDFLGSVESCANLSLTLPLIDIFSKPPQTEEDIRRRMTDGVKVINECSLPLEVAATKVWLVGEREDIGDAANELALAVQDIVRPGRQDAPDEKTMSRYFIARGTFDVKARASANPPTFTPGLVLGLILFLIGLLAVGANIALMTKLQPVRRAKGRVSTTPHDEAPPVPIPGPTDADSQSEPPS